MARTEDEEELPLVLLVGLKGSLRLRTFGASLGKRLASSGHCDDGEGREHGVLQLDTKYYTANIELVELGLVGDDSELDDEKTMEALQWLTERRNRVEALILFGDGSCNVRQAEAVAGGVGHLRKLLDVLARAFSGEDDASCNKGDGGNECGGEHLQEEPLPHISVKLLVLESKESSAGEWRGIKRNVLFDWSYDNGFELVDTVEGDSAFRERNAENDGATSSRCQRFGLLSAEGSEETVNGLERVVEALECHMWPNMRRKQKGKEGRPNVGPSSSPADKTGEDVDNSNLAASKGEAPLTNNEAAEVASDIKDVEGFERLIAQMSDFRLNEAKGLSDTERRERASQLIMKLSAMLGD